MHRTVWMLTDPGTGEVAYVRHGQQEDPEHWKTIGPFSYSTEEQAQQATLGNEWFQSPLGILEMDASVFIQALFNGFPPSNTDVFALDNSFLPLSPSGAEWVDAALGRPQWAMLFDEDSGTGLRWLDQVLTQVGTHIGLDLSAMRSIGDLVTSEEEVANEVEQAKKLVLEHVRVAIIPELDPSQLPEPQHLVPVTTTFWLHTKGLDKLGLPELEIRGVPAWWVTAAGAELNAWAAYSTQHPIQDGQTLQGGGPVPVVVRAERSADPYWERRSCLQLVLDRVIYRVQLAPKLLH